MALEGQERRSTRFTLGEAVGGVFASSGGVVIGGLIGLFCGGAVTELSPEVVKFLVSDYKYHLLGATSTTGGLVGSFRFFNTYRRMLQQD
jgi:hypothetical protein